MSGNMIVSIVAAVAWLILAIGALASYRLSRGKMITLALVWAAIFAAGFLIVTWLQPETAQAPPLSRFT